MDKKHKYGLIKIRSKKTITALLLGIFLIANSPLPVYAHTGGNHQKITKEAAEEAGYGEDAVEKLGKGNVGVDKYQGTKPGTPDEPGANAHGMTSPGQSEDEAKEGAKAYKDAKKEKAADELLEGNIEEALEELGKGTHTVQDELQHKFEGWDGWWSWWNLTVFYAVWFYGKLAVHGIKDAVLTDDEKEKNVEATKEYLKEFEARFMEKCREAGKTQEQCEDLLRQMKEWKK